MIDLTLAADGENLAPTNPFPSEFGGGRPLYHQLRTFEALERAHLVVNSHNTGTGKTRAALLHLLRRPDGNTLFIAPTNELLRQHAVDIEAFIARNNLPLDVLRIDRSVVRDLAGQTSLERQGARLHALLQSPALVSGRAGGRRYVLVINPDIFYYALYFRYGRHDRRNLFRDFVGGFDYVVVDELHYYDAKQLASFLFFLVLLAEYGFFEAGGRACMLTATPNEEVRRYLDRLGLCVEYVDRATEPPEGGGLKRAPSLAPVHLRLVPREALAPAGLEHLVAEELAALVNRVHAGEQGAIISSALWRINHIWNTLGRSSIRERCGRLTGPENGEARGRARLLDLILATPTVDLGYNFERADRPRQNVDFLYFDARYTDELLQRLGRAGRVLGKQQTDIPSTVVAICPDELVEALRPRAGTTIARDDFSATARGRLRPRHDLYSYIETGAIGEAFLPIYRLREMTEREKQERLGELFDRVKSVFAPSSHRDYWCLHAEVREFLRREALFDNWPVTEVAQRDRAVDPFIRANGGPYTPAQCERLRAEAHRPSALREHLLRWIEEERAAYEVKRSLYTFRESFEGPLALVYDPRGLLSSQPVRTYDLFHIVAGYEAHWWRSAAEWGKATGQGLPPGLEVSALCELVALRPVGERMRLRYVYEAGQTREDWQNRFLRGPTALRGLRVEAENGSLPRPVVEALAEQYVVCYARDPHARGGGQLAVLGRHGDARVVRLEVELDGEGRREYLAVLGTGAFFAHAELGWLDRLEARRHAREGGAIFA